MIELGCDVYGHLQRGQRLRDESAVRRGARKVAAQSNERVGTAAEHGADRGQHVVTRLAGRRKSKFALERIEECRGGILIDAYGAVALYVGVTAHRAYSRPR